MPKGAQWSPNGRGLLATREDLGQAPPFCRPLAAHAWDKGLI
jgi:hypothetical protein